MVAPSLVDRLSVVVDVEAPVIKMYAAPSVDERGDGDKIVGFSVDLERLTCFCR